MRKFHPVLPTLLAIKGVQLKIKIKKIYQNNKWLIAFIVKSNCWVGKNNFYLSDFTLEWSDCMNLIIKNSKFKYDNDYN